MTYVICKGVKFTIVAIVEGERCPLQGYLQGLDEAGRKKVMALLQMTAEIGPLSNVQKFKKVKGTKDLYELKSFQVRLPCFFGARGTIVITHGFTKKRNGMPSSEKDRALRMMREFKERK